MSPSHSSALEGVALCDAHADRISVPFGWTLVDDRSPPKRKRRKKKAVSVAAEPKSDVQPALSEALAQPAVAQPVNQPDTADTTAQVVAADPIDDYIEPEFQFREDGDTSDPEDESAPGAAADQAKAAQANERADQEDENEASPKTVEPRFTVVPGADSAEAQDSPASEEDVQKALGESADDAEPEPEPEPDESTPLLQRAFRVVRDD